MEMDSLIASAKSIQIYTHIYASVATLWTYDYICSFHDEWTFLLRSRWTKTKGLYIVTRYLPFLLLSGHLYLDFDPYSNPDKCRKIANILESLAFISANCSEWFFILRTYALWNKNRILLGVMLTTSFAMILASISVLFTTTSVASYETSVTPGITGCYIRSNTFWLFLPFLLLFAHELGLAFLTVTCAIQNWRMTSNHLFTVLLKHNVFYYTCGLFLSAVNVMATLFLRYTYNTMFQQPQIMILAILATRMHLQLWHSDQCQRIYTTSNAVIINMSPVPVPDMLHEAV